MKIFSELWKPALIAVVFVAAMLVPVYYNSQSKINQPQPIVQLQKTPSIEELKQIIEALPNGPLKANFYIVLATEYAGDSAALHDILNAFAKMQMEKLQNKNTSTKRHTIT